MRHRSRLDRWLGTAWIVSILSLAWPLLLLALFAIAVRLAYKFSVAF